MRSDAGPVAAEDDAEPCLLFGLEPDEAFEFVTVSSEAEA